MRVISERHLGKKVVFGTIAWAIMRVFLMYLLGIVQVEFGWIRTVGIGREVYRLIYCGIFALSVSAAIFVCERIDAHYDVARKRK